MKKQLWAFFTGSAFAWCVLSAIIRNESLFIFNALLLLFDVYMWLVNE